MTVTYSDVQGGFPGQGNIAFHPIFVHQRPVTFICWTDLPALTREIPTPLQ